MRASNSSGDVKNSKYAFWYTYPLLGPQPNVLSLLRMPFTAGCELIVRNPRPLILASCPAMTDVSLSTGWSDQGNAESWLKQNFWKRDVTSLKVDGWSHSLIASSFCMMYVSKSAAAWGGTK